MANQTQQKTVHANRCRVMLRGLELAEGTNVTVQESGGTQRVSVIGKITAAEHIHNAYDCSAQVNALYWHENAIAEFAMGGQDGNRLYDLPPVNIELLSDDGEKTIAVVADATLASRQLSISANQPLSRNLSFMGIAMDGPVVAFDQPTSGPGPDGRF